MSYESTVIGLCSLAVLTLIPPFAWHTQTRNVPALILISWLLLMDITCLINAAIWSGDDFYTRWEGKGYCDIVIKLQVGANIGISCAVANIVYNLHTILKADRVLPDFKSWKKIGVDLSISLSTPIVAMALSYFLQVYRFGIAKYNGCQNLMTATWLTIVLYTMWMLIWSTIGTVYAILVLIVFYRKRKDVRDILHCTNSGLNFVRFSRLLTFCFLIILVMFPFSIYSFVSDLKQVNGSYSFSETHSGALWNLVLFFDPGKPLYDIWLYVLMSYLVFLIFGLGSDALDMYAKFIRFIRLGFILDFGEGFIEERKKGRVGQLFGYSTDGTDFQNMFTSSDEDNYKNTNDFNSSIATPTSNRDIYVDYRIPTAGWREEKRRNKNYHGDLNNFHSDDLTEEVALDSNYLPYLANKSNLDDIISLDGFSSMTVGSTQGRSEESKSEINYKTEEFGTPSTAGKYVTSTKEVSLLSSEDEAD
ncbi:hypothetical protein KAFR_0G00330 [Kazachstania africana CBS 2517]|uniref:Uncharacterized protein n=1 Tax=Kazachstania africana (strain ATCC 22294 / BCRC 22015 / CBS 2517 / CECT 1963 / NBRC 1671 / NRRL Y-8276) TaxID=1071382 RepID=H2AXG6_KAZAF|nr:hypothetical protein KAFR_0G00330 [Kazachstania africana CBS 2517]CCF59066.1 hypothetical protein KAFR_0G00330 [Kazachstania africana CBS 2517]